MKRHGKTDPNKFNRSDWMIVIILGLLVLSGVLFGLFKLAEFEQTALDNQTENLVENDGEVRGSTILDIFVNKKTALVLIIGDGCDEDTECSDYLSNLFLDLLNTKQSAPAIFVFDTVAARERGDTNLEVILQELSVNEFPALVLIESGMIVNSKEGTGDENDELHNWLVKNGIVISDDENSRN